ncbi:MAG: sugar nucleotide-binding protein, partial [Candidatus Beckwithbacteria bacterium]
SRAYQESNNKQGMVYQVNVLGTQNIAAACKKYHHYLIHISTDFVFDGQKQEPYTEADQPHPIEWYGQTKLWAEQKVIDSGCQNVIARLAFPFRSNFPKKPDLVRNILEKLKTNSLYPMFIDQIITPTFIDDICQVLKVFINKKPQGIYHVVGSTFLSSYDLAVKIAQVFNLKAEIKPGSFKEYLKTDPRPRNQYSKVSNAKLKKDLGITMKTIDEALLVLKGQLAVA